MLNLILQIQQNTATRIFTHISNAVLFSNCAANITLSADPKCLSPQWTAWDNLFYSMKTMDLYQCTFTCKHLSMFTEHKDQICPVFTGKSRFYGY